MTDTASLRLSRLIRDTEGVLLPLTEMADDVVVARVEFGFDLPQAPISTPAAAHTASLAEAADHGSLGGTVVLITETLRSPAGVAAVLTDYAGAAALVVPPGTHSHLGDRVHRQGSADRVPALLERSPHVTWSEILVHLRQLTEGATSALAWPDVDDLSALAAVIAETTDASITIEDPASRVLAHANLGGELDEIRRETILSGAIPDWRIAELEESGFLDMVRRSTDVVERPAEGTSPARSVIALRSEGELIGTIWAAYPAEVDPEPLREVLRDAARAALPVMLRTLRRSPFEKRIRREALGAILAGSADLGPSATLLSLPFSGSYCVLAFTEVAPEREPVLRFHLRAAFADAVLAHLSSAGGSSVRTSPAHAGQTNIGQAGNGLAHIGADRAEAGQGRHLAALVQMSEPMNAERVRDHVIAVLRRSLPTAETLRFGVGTPVDRLDVVHRSWTEAAYIVDAVRNSTEDDPGSDDGGVADTQTPKGSDAQGGPGARGRIVGATIRDVSARVAGLQVADVLLSADERTSSRVLAPAQALAAHDGKHNGSLLDTLRVYFATVGNSAEASRRLHVHTNSLRHRLGRIEEITGLSTAEPAERLWLELSVLVYDRS
ncbi:PucR C-terminal helix-turn-helix domain-containing protein [Brevibacterium siliguriense]|uniref:PucR C-terminal helix-turn-helix domain-containing protein n=1 Tax=Brevibacterium siliguriense TaxID=1136497 RepID=A0A1H1PL48_9MICO|nr:PucR family transcriptional regulator [Brevibacterium siliguriense]SDS11834.1 PucR C-terminal helix-turn-helix domain-containing protein [Brevibacterium siliguriense]